jgi:hypothetical protein
MEGTIAAPNSLACFMHNFSFYISHQLGIESLANYQYGCYGYGHL